LSQRGHDAGLRPCPFKYHRLVNLDLVAQLESFGLAHDLEECRVGRGDPTTEDAAADEDYGTGKKRVEKTECPDGFDANEVDGRAASTDSGTSDASAYDTAEPLKLPRMYSHRLRLDFRYMWILTGSLIIHADLPMEHGAWGLLVVAWP
jgi:hypothetical protein